MVSVAARWLYGVSVLCLVGVSGPVSAEQVSESAAKWSFALRGGAFFPDVDDWETFYGRDQVAQFGAKVGRRFASMLEFEVEADYFGERGEGSLPLNDRKGGEVLHEQGTLSAGVLLHAQFSPRQLLVPYGGAGYAHVFYQQSIQGGQQNKGGADGVYVRGGLALLMDGWDREGSSSLRRYWGIEHTYLLIDYRVLDVEKNDVDIGGDTLSLGIYFAF